jgi:RNA polymerase sigma-70 factor (ECF subfamily)
MSIGMIDGAPEAPARAKHSKGSVREIVDPDSELVERWQAGDETAFRDLIRRHERRVYRLLFRMMGSHEEAEDVAQEAFLSLHRHGHRFRREARFSTFVYRVAANAALNRRRALGRSRNRVNELKISQEAGFDTASGPRDPEDAAAGSEARARVQEALLELPDDLRMAVLLYDIEGQSYQEVSRALGIPEGTVKSRIHRARNTLRERLRSYVEAGSAEGGREGASS